MTERPAQRRPGCSATIADGKSIPKRGPLVSGLVHVPVEVRLAPGQEVELESRIHGAAGRRYELVPAGGEWKRTTREWPLVVGSGKVGLQYERVFGNSSSGEITLAPALRTLGTGKLELDIREAKE